MKESMSAREASYKWGVSESSVHKLCQAGCTPNLERFGRSWVITEDTEKPTDPRHDRQNAQIKTAEQEEKADE